MRIFTLIFILTVSNWAFADKINFELRGKNFSMVTSEFCYPEEGSQQVNKFEMLSKKLVNNGFFKPVFMLVDCQYNVGDRSKFYRSFYAYPNNTQMGIYNREQINSMHAEFFKNLPKLSLNELVNLVKDDTLLINTFDRSITGQFIVEDNSEIFTYAVVRDEAPYSIGLMGVEFEGDEVFYTVMDIHLLDFVDYPERHFNQFRAMTRSINKSLN